jgi:proline dehydrogenase
VITRIRRLLLVLLAPVLTRAGTAYLAGRDRGDAVETAGQLADLGYAVSLAYWNDPDDSAADVERELLGCIADLAGRPGRPQVAVKAPTFGFDPAVVDRLAAAARDAGVGLVFDAHGPDDADRTLTLAARAASAGAQAGAALPARWRRSRGDAATAAAAGLGVRVVKGQWADPLTGAIGVGEEGLRAATRDLVEVLAGLPVPVAVATHDTGLLAGLLDARPADAVLEIELLFGLPASGPLRVAGRRGVPVRFYVAYGSPGLAFRISSVLRRPRLAVTLAEGVLRGAGNQRRRRAEARAAAAVRSTSSA